MYRRAGQSRRAAHQYRLSPLTMPMTLYSTSMETFAVRDYDAGQHDKFRALGLSADLAEKLTRISCVIDGVPEAECSVVFQPKNTDYRGDVLICAVSDKYKEQGYICGLAELKEVRPARSLSSSERNSAVIPAGVDYMRSYAFFFCNPRRVVEMPCHVKKAFYTLVIPKDQVTEYPMNVVIGEDEWRKIRARYGIR
jgi:hypothetical protein